MEKASTNKPDALAPWQLGVIETFRQIAQFLGIPKSVGEIYGLLYSSEVPLSLDDMSQLLGLSKGAVSKGLDYLKRYDAVNKSFQLGERREHYVAELELARIAEGFMQAQVERDMQSWGKSLSMGAALLENGDKALLGKSDPAFVSKQVKKLEHWHSALEGTIPLLKKHFQKHDA